MQHSRPAPAQQADPLRDRFYNEHQNHRGEHGRNGGVQAIIEN
jgi:hypothetical protein